MIKTSKCFNCEEFGHESRDCTKACGICQSTSHKSGFHLNDHLYELVSLCLCHPGCSFPLPPQPPPSKDVYSSWHWSINLLPVRASVCDSPSGIPLTSGSGPFVSCPCRPKFTLYRAPVFGSMNPSLTLPRRALLPSPHHASSSCLFRLPPSQGKAPTGAPTPGAALGADKRKPQGARGSKA
jgi:hypothetical protein